MNRQNSRGGEWVWVTHFIAIFLVTTYMGIIIYSVVGVDNIELAKVTMGFSSGILGVILGFYFIRERLTKESKEKDYFMSQARELESVSMTLKAALAKTHDRVEEEPEE